MTRGCPRPSKMPICQDGSRRILDKLTQHQVVAVWPIARDMSGDFVASLGARRLDPSHAILKNLQRRANYVAKWLKLLWRFYRDVA